MPAPCPCCGTITSDLKTLNLLTERNSVVVSGREIIFSKTLFNLFSHLYRRMPNHVTHDSIMTVLYADSLEPPFDAALKMHIMKLRRLLEPTELNIKTIWGVGYRLEFSEHFRKQSKA